MLEIYDGAINVDEVISRWYKESSYNNGACTIFVGTVRDDNGIEGLSFDIYKPILDSWFQEWERKAKKLNAIVRMAHSSGDVPVGKSSYISAVFSRKRRTALELLDEFVEDFKHNAPIWKYDIKDGKRIYAKDRSYKLQGSGLLR